MKHLYSDKLYDYYESYYQGNPIRMRVNRATGEKMVSMDDLAKAVGYSSLQDSLLKNEGAMNFYLDALNNGQAERSFDEDIRETPDSD